MRTQRTLVCVAAVALLAACHSANSAAAQEFTYAVEVNGVLCGYAELKISTAETDGKKYTLVKHNVFATVSLLGSKFDTTVNTTMHVDPATGQYTYIHGRTKKGDREDEVQVFVEGNKARFVYPLEKKEKSVDLPEGVLLDNPSGAPHLLRDFVKGSADSKTYQVLALLEAKVQDVVYTRVKQESIKLAGETRYTLVLDARNRDTGVVMRHWVDVKTGMTVKLTFPNRRLVYLADASVKKRVKMANLDSTILAKANVVISDVPSISYMKVRAVLEPTGLKLSPEALNVPGQKFEGTVKSNRVEGVFTIQHPLYKGAGAPPFPPEHGKDKTLAEFLAPTQYIQSDDPVLVRHAKRVTKGASNSWDAACRLSRWVAENIDYAIPGGGDARRTFDTRAGECGAHSLLLACLCRSVGIPARVVWGCMYVPSRGGTFGQHGWTEVYMGEAGWIPVDATAKEVDFVDSGHIRIGYLQSLATAVNLKEVEILAHRLRKTGEKIDDDARSKLRAFVGKYVHPSGRRSYEVQVRETGLVLVTPEKVALGLRSPDESGRWYAKLASHIYCTFPRNEQGEITALTIHEILRMRRKANPEKIDENVPEALRQYLGTYRLAAIRADFKVLCKGGSLAVYYPTRKRTLGFKPTKEPGRFTAASGMHEISFGRDDKGAVTTLFLDAGTLFHRQEQAALEHPEIARVKAMLLDWHGAAAEAEGERFFSHLAEDAILMGTDASERWTVQQLKALVEPLFAKGTGWTTLPTEQHVYLAAGGRLAWFDERLKSSKYGEMRGSGVVRKSNGEWKIVHYNRAFPIPNELVKELVKKIHEVEQRK
jgi:ketosteroid isomerase-like protein